MSVEKATEEILKSCIELGQVIIEIDKVDEMREELMNRLTEHTNHCTASAALIKEAFESMKEENAKLRQSLDELEAEMYSISRTMK
jgi:hypothetical protein